MAESIVSIAERLKRSTRHPDVLALCEYVLSGAAAPVAQVAQVAAAPKPAFDKRSYQREYMRKRRAGPARVDL